ncbi:hypothetical protein J2W42_002790 [Rhizobium tibeticum]|nr:hypothetical protein [Rhizobium tibeticum]
MRLFTLHNKLFFRGNMRIHAPASVAERIFSHAVKHNIDEPPLFTRCFRPAPKDGVKICQYYK